jgi:hypothetical protein
MEDEAMKKMSSEINRLHLDRTKLSEAKEA